MFKKIIKDELKEFENKAQLESLIKETVNKSIRELELRVTKLEANNFKITYPNGKINPNIDYHGAIYFTYSYATDYKIEIVTLPLYYCDQESYEYKIIRDKMRTYIGIKSKDHNLITEKYAVVDIINKQSIEIDDGIRFNNVNWIKIA
jgi:hypothetical protein